MDLPQDELLAANALIHRHGDAAEEVAARQLWESRQKEDHDSAARWLSLIQALKWVRKLKAKVDNGS